MLFEISGIFSIIIEAENARDARAKAEKILRKAHLRGIVIEVVEREGERCPDATKTPEIGRNQNP